MRTTEQRPPWMPPCGLDAFQSKRFGTQMERDDSLCYVCAKSDENGGKCAGASPSYFMLCLLGPLMESLQDLRESEGP